MHPCAFTETFSSAHLCCAAVHTIVSSPGRTAAADSGREGESSWLWRQYLERQVGQCCSRNLTCARCQHQATATKAYNWASAISWPSRWTAVSSVTSEKLADWSVHDNNTHPDFETGNYRENCACYNRIFTVEYDFVTNFLLSLTVKEFWKSVNIWWSYRQQLGVSFFLIHSVVWAKQHNNKKQPSWRTEWQIQFMMVIYISEHVRVPSVLWYCWLGIRKSIRPVKIWVLVWLFVRSEVQFVCIWSSWCHSIPKPYHLLPNLNPDWFTFLVQAYPGYPKKEAIKPVY